MNAPSGQIQRRILVSGRVQGVSYRASTMTEAGRFAELRGWVRNLPDGRVEAVFSGERSSVEAMISWCRRGPLRAQVTEMTVSEEGVDPALAPFHVSVASS